MLKNPLKRGSKKSFLAIFSFLTALTLLTLFLLNTRKPITASLTSLESKFKVTFNIPKNHQKTVTKALSGLNLPTDLKEFEFRLDATSSAKLAFAQPINAKIFVEPKKIRILGSEQIPFEEVVMNNIKLPQETNLAVFGTDLTGYLSTKVKGQILPAWIKDNTQKGQYFAVFDKEANYVFAAKMDESKLEELKSITSDESYKKEEADGISYHLVKLGENDLSETLVLFHQNGYLFLTSSLDSAKKVSGSQTGQNYLFKAPKEPVSFHLIFENKNKVEKAFFDFIIPDAENTVPYLSKIRSLDFTLKETRFSALINLE